MESDSKEPSKDDSSPAVKPPVKPPVKGDWAFRVLLTSTVLAAGGYLLLWHGLAVYRTIADYLPLLLPLAVTVLSILTRATEIRNYESVLRMSNDLAIGIISFDIWAISVSRSGSGVLVNDDKMIQGKFVLPFLLSGLLVAVGCVVLTHYNFRDERTKQRWLLAGLLASITVYAAPFGALEAVPKESEKSPQQAEIRQFTVVIPYQDPDIARPL